MTPKTITTKQAHRRYMSAMGGTALGYVGSLFGVTFALNKLVTGGDASAPLIFGLALIPGVFVLGMIWSFWRYLHEMDEAQRYFMMRAIMVGLVVVLSLSGVWGLIEMLTFDAPRLPVFWILPIFFGVFGLASCFGPGRGMGCQ